MSDREYETDDVLSVNVSSDSDFSGFSPVSEPPSTPKLRSKVVKSKKKAEKGKSKKKDGKKEKTRHKCKGKDKENSASSGATENIISKLSEADIDNLRGLLGIQQSSQMDTYEECDPNEQFEWQNPAERLPLRVEIDSADISGDELEGHCNLEQGFRCALGNEEDEWDLPKVDSREKGRPVSASLAKMINMACTSSCDIQGVLETNKVPENCDKAIPPLVNPEVWRIMDKKTRAQDRILSEMQSIVAGAISPIARLAEHFKPQIAASSEAKALISDALTCLGQTQYKLSLRRRYAIRPALNYKYTSLCSMNTPVTNLLFGDDIGREIKACDSYSYIGKGQNYRGSVSRGRGFGRFPRRPYQQHGATGYGQGNMGYGQRYQPYPSRGQPIMRGNLRGYHIPKRTAPTATVSAPNGKA